MSSQPTTLMCWGTRRPLARIARIAPIAVTSLWQTTAVMSQPPASSSAIARSPPSNCPSPRTSTMSVAGIPASAHAFRKPSTRGRSAVNPS